MNLPMSKAQNLSHEQRGPDWQAAKQALGCKIKKRGDLPHVSVQKQLELLDQLGEFELGQFLIERGGLNGYWTHYVLHTVVQLLPPLEIFLLLASPTSLAMQQRFSIFKDLIQKQIREGCSFASLPSGLMGDLLDLDYSAIDNFSLHGIDLDPETLISAKNYAEEKGLLPHCHFSQKDAWQLKLNEEFDLITSNGLTIYEPDDEKVTLLYRQFYNALKPSGMLVTSFLTPPPSPGSKTEWKLDLVNLQDASLQKILFVDILAGKWQVFRAEETVKAQLLKAGFRDIEIHYDKAHIFPTVVAKK